MVYFLTGLICFLLNLSLANSFIISLLNGLNICLSLLVANKIYDLDKKNISVFLVLLLGLMPIFTYSPETFVVPLLLTASLVFLYLSRKNNILFLVISLSAFSLSLAYSNGILNFPFQINYHWLIYNRELVEHWIITHQRDARFLPYPVRRVAYNRTIYVYEGLSDFFKLVDLRNLSDLILFANLYPLGLGIKKIFKSKKIKFLSFYLLSAILIIGLSRYIDKFKSLYALGPFLLHLIYLGLPKLNKKIYLGLMAFSIYLAYYG